VEVEVQLGAFEGDHVFCAAGDGQAEVLGVVIGGGLEVRGLQEQVVGKMIVGFTHWVGFGPETQISSEWRQNKWGD
jgi:hypothetical protein